MMVTISFLDKTLNFIKKKGIYGLIEEDTPEFTAEENEYLHEAVWRLEKDGYVYSKHQGEYLVSFDGMLALRETYWFKYKNKPYQRERCKRRMERVWLVIKIICGFLNAIAIIILGILSLFKDQLLKN